MNTDKMLQELIKEIQDSSAYYSDIPYVFDLLQSDKRFYEYRKSKGLLEDFEKEREGN